MLILILGTGVGIVSMVELWPTVGLLLQLRARPLAHSVVGFVFEWFWDQFHRLGSLEVLVLARTPRQVITDNNLWVFLVANLSPIQQDQAWCEPAAAAASMVQLSNSQCGAT